MNRLKLILLVCLVATFVASSAFGMRYSRDWTQEEYDAAFDEVARNFGAVEYATYTFMVEFSRAPDSLDELRQTGHLNVLMSNPYTGGEVRSLTRADFPDGDLAGNIFVADRDEGREAHIQAFYVRNTNPPTVRSMIKRVYLYQSEVDHRYMFENDLPRDEQMVVAYCLQAIDALESFRQKVGESPKDFEDMYVRGDVNVHYINPITGELVVSSQELSAGNYFYRKIGDEGYLLIGWGRTRPVFFATTDESEEEKFYQTWPELAGD